MFDMSAVLKNRVSFFVYETYREEFASKMDLLID